MTAPLDQTGLVDRAARLVETAKCADAVDAIAVEGMTVAGR